MERAKQAFLEAIAATNIEEIPTEFAQETAENLAQNLSESKLFLLGEMHGVKENADVIYTLFKKFGFRQLALEWQSECRDAALTFADSGELDFNTVATSDDGRITAGHFALIKKLEDEGLLDDLICFDASNRDWNVRDATMADNILAHVADDVYTLAVAGNLHTKTERMTFKGDTYDYHPMGENVRKVIPNVPSGRIEYEEGQYFNTSLKDFPTRKSLSTTAQFSQSSDDNYTFDLPLAHAASVPGTLEP